MDREERYRAATSDGVPRRVLVTLLFTDLVGSTRLAATLGDRRWTLLLKAHHARVRDLLDRWGGCEVDDAGDGFFATFEAATPAVRCASAVSGSLAELGLRARAGLHTGECVRDDGKVRGVAVHAGARVVRHAGPGEVLVTRTVRDVVAGSDLEFEDRGSHALRGLPGLWQLYAALAGDGVPVSDQNGHRDVTHAPRRVRRAVSITARRS
jgi:class 3 adenylate cyclase